MRMSDLVCKLMVCGMLLVSGCGGVRKPTSISQAAIAEAAINQGDLATAALEYERLAKKQRRQRIYYALLAAEAWRDDGKFQDVRRVLATLNNKKLSAEQNFQYDLLLAEALLNQGEPEQADALLTYPEERVPVAERLRFLELRAKVMAANAKWLDAVTIRLQLNSLLSLNETVTNEREIQILLKQLSTEETVIALGTMNAADVRRPWLERSLRERGVIPARAAIRPVRPIGTWMRDNSGKLQAEGFQASGFIALLLPVSGEYAAAGRAILDGFMSAYYADGRPERERVQVFDSGSDKQSVLLALDAAIAAGARQIVGPLERSQVDSVFAQHKPGVKILALNFAGPSVLPPVESCQFGLSPEEEAALIAEHLIESGISHVVILGSAEDWSERAARAFTAQYLALGGKVHGEKRVAPAAVKFASELDSLLGKSGLTTEPSALFAPIRATQARMLMPQLRAYGKKEIIVVATSHVYSGNSNPVLDRDLDGISFVDAPFISDTDNNVLGRATLGASLVSANASPRLFAFGIDAYRLLPFTDSLRRNEGSYLEGATGQLLVDPFGRVRRLSRWYRFTEGQPRMSQSLAPMGNLSSIAAPAALPRQ